MNNTEVILQHRGDFKHQVTSLAAMGGGLVWSFTAKLIWYIEGQVLAFQQW